MLKTEIEWSTNHL